MCSDLFCAFQPNRVMVPSLPLWFKVPEMPRRLLLLAAVFFSRVDSSRFSIRPAPKVGVGIRKIMSFACCAAAKLGCGRLQLPASVRPLTVNRSSTPPLGLLVFAVPLALKKNGNRASRVGPLAVTKYGVESFGATELPAKANWGLTAAPLPPTAGCAWQELQLFELNRGPRPTFAELETASTAWNRPRPSWKKAVKLFGSFWELMIVAPVPRLALCTPGSV